MGHYAWPHVDASGALSNKETGEALHVVHQYYTRQHRHQLPRYYAKVAPWLRGFDG